VSRPVLDELERRARRRRLRRRLRRHRFLAGGAAAVVCCTLASGAVLSGHGDAAPKVARAPVARAAMPRSVTLLCPVPAVLRGPFARASRAAGLVPALLVAVAQAESELEMHAVSPRGARGLLQLMPETANELGADPDRPAENLAAGARYLRGLLDRFGSLQLALAAYDAGPTTVDAYDGVPPFAETQRYVERIVAQRHVLSGCRFG
jgi:soluble lytic murein transglycosylase-like protein